MSVSPRMTGFAVAGACAGAGVVSALFISNPVWGIPAAVALSFSAAGVGAGLLLIRRKDWSDRTWPPGGEPREWTAKRSRRFSLIYGMFFLALSVFGFFGLWVSAFGSGETAARGWVLFAITTITGAVLTISGLRRVGPPVESTARVGEERPENDPEWVRLGAGRAAGTFSTWAALSASPHLLIPFVLLTLAPFTLELPLWASVAAFAAVIVALVVSGIALVRRSAAPGVSRDGARMRVRSTEAAAAEIVTAMIVFTPWEPDATERNLGVVLGTANGLRAFVALRRRGKLVLTEEQSRLLLEFVARSEIELPHDKDDPRGRFSRALYPNFLEKAEALDLIRRPPGDGERLPAATGGVR